MNRITAVLFILVTGYSCSVEKNTNLSRFFHNLNSHYNIYFNGYQSYLEGLKKIENSNRDDYSTVMPLFLFSDPANVTSAGSNMDVAIQKASKVISLHSMTAKPERKNNRPLSSREQEFYARKEYNNWVDDSYLLMGKAQVYRNDYESARITLMHNIRESVDNDIKAESTIWLARTYAELKNYPEARRLLTELNDKGIPSALLADYYLTLSDLQVKQENMRQAIPPLGDALDKMNARFDRARYTYILARMNEESGNAVEAGRLYREVMHFKPPYEMEFNARINQAGVFDVESGDIGDMKKGLAKLLRDAKNKEYHDQIYYAMGNLSMREGNVEEAIENYRRSAAASTFNTTQKGRSYLMLAEYYFSQYDYRASQVYYDSAVTFLDNKYPGYDQFHERSLNLNELTGFLSTVEREDSLQYVASLPAPQREALISGIIRKIEQEEREAANQINDRYNMGQFYENERRFRSTTDVSGKWYFYNQAALTFGRSEFRNRWGQRKLEDNWRRANKSRVTAMPGEEGEQVQEADTISSVVNPKAPEFYLKDLPLTDSLVKVSDERIASALFNAGRVFRDRLNDNGKAEESYLELLSRFPDHLLVPETLYNLYNLNKDTNPSQAQAYKARLISEYPGSEFTLILTNPEYFNQQQQEARRAESLYAEAYTAWENNRMDRVLEICNSAIGEFPDNELTPRFMLLRAYATGSIVDERNLKEQLTVIRDRFPATPEGRRAAELIAYLNSKVPELKVEEEKQIAGEIYSADISGPHYFIVVIKNKALDMNRLTFDVINYNIDNYTNENYSTRGELVNDDHIRISVGPFPGPAEAREYFDRFDPAGVIKNSLGAEILKFLISQPNLVILDSDKDPDRYMLFFREKYMPEKLPDR